MKISAALPTGVAALFFDSARRRRQIEATLAGRLLAVGFSEVILPVLDYAEPYESILTPASRAERYRFVDRDGELLALRADFTPMLARLLAPRLASLSLPLKLFYRGDVVRWEDEGPRRPREFYQLGAELLGTAGERGEREGLALFLELLELATRDGPGPVQVILGLAGALDPLLLASADPSGLAAAVARRERVPVRAASKALLQVLEQGVPEDPGDLGTAADRLVRLLALRDELAARFPTLHLTVDLAEFAHQVLDPRLNAVADERSYYDGLVFRAHAGATGLPVGGGGRYDRLFRSFGAEVPAVGFSLGLDLLLAPAGRTVGAEAAAEVGA